MRKILEFFNPDRKRRWKLIPMRALNADPAFVAMVMTLQRERDELAKDSGLKNVTSKSLLMMCYCMDTQQRIS